MASFPPPISILSLSAESGTFALVIIGFVLALVGLVQNQAQDSVFPWGTRQFREDRAAAKALVKELRLELKVSAASSVCRKG